MSKYNFNHKWENIDCQIMSDSLSSVKNFIHFYIACTPQKIWLTWREGIKDDSRRVDGPVPVNVEHPENSHDHYTSSQG